MSKKGFGLLEVLISVAIIVMVLAGIGAINSYSAETSELNLRRATAYNFAQEGIEMVRKERDGNFLSATNWKQSILPASANTAQVINGINYIRTVTVDAPTSLPSGLDVNSYQFVTAKVEWQEYGQTWSVETKTLLTNWKSL